MRKRIITAAATILSAVATGLAVSYYLPFWIEFVSLVPFLFVLFSYADGERWFRRGIRLGFLYFYAYYLMVWHWFLQMYPLDFTGISPGGALAVVVVAWLGLPLLQTVVAMLQVPLFLYMTRSTWLSKEGRLRSSAPAVFGAVYVLFEWIQTLTWAGVPWGRLAIGQSYVPEMIGVASLFGSYAVSFVIAVVNGYIAYALVAYHNGEKRRAAASAAAALLILTANVTYGSVRIYIKEANAFAAAEVDVDKITLNVAVMQGNISSKDKWKDNSYSNMLATYTELVEDAVMANADLAVFPESALPGCINDDKRPIRSDLEEIAELNEIELAATGFWKEENGDIYNSVIIVDPHEGLDDKHIYYKRHLVPFGEFVPYEDLCRMLVPPLAELGLFDASISTGDRGNVLETLNGKIGAMVCFDSIYESSSLDEVRAGAELLTVSTNDSWFDGSAAVWQHTAQSILRAVECDRYVCRAGNTGFSCIISPTGEILASIEPETRGIVTHEVEMRSTRTLYSYIGDSMIAVIALGVVTCVIFVMIGNRKNKKQKERRM